MYKSDFFSKTKKSRPGDPALIPLLVVVGASRDPTPHPQPLRHMLSLPDPEYETLGLATWGPLGRQGGEGQPCLPSSDCVRPAPAHSFTEAMLSQPRMDGLDNPTAYRVGLALLGVGGVLVLSSFFALGFTGTFLGKSPWAGALETTHLRSEVLPALLSIPSVSPGTSSFGPQAVPGYRRKLGSHISSSCLAIRQGVNHMVVPSSLRGWVRDPGPPPL